MIIQPKNWHEFQHYKDRSPSWIKLHKSILDNYEYHQLPLASKALAPFLWLLASEYTDGKIEAPVEKIAFRVRLTVKELESALQPLISSTFFTIYQDASNPLADCKQDAVLEKRREENINKEKRIADFELFWDAFNYKKGKGGAESAWLKISGYCTELFEVIIEAAKKEAISRPELIRRNLTPKMAQGWLTERRWEDEGGLITEPEQVTSWRQLPQFAGGR